MALLIVMTSATIIGVAYYLAYRNPVDFNPSHAVAILLLALMATGAGEYSREMLRKPYVIGRWMYSNGVRVPYALKIDQTGYLAHSNWVWNGADSSYSRGEAIFRGECGSCHTLNGYRPLAKLARRPRPRQHRELHHHAARVQARLALSPLHAAHGGHESRTSTT
jgi:cytochrome bd ubiquinol oxidase subunit I